MFIFTLGEKQNFKLKNRKNYFLLIQRLWKLFYLLLATHLCEVCVQCLLVLYASVHEVCANIYMQRYIYIYIMQIHQNSNIYLYLNFLLQLGSSLVRDISLAKLWLFFQTHMGTKKRRRLSQPGRGQAIYTNTYI